MIYTLPNGETFDTGSASLSWSEASDWDGQWWQGRETKAYLTDQRLYLAREGGFFVETDPLMRPTDRTLRQISDEDAIRWLLRNDHAVPERLRLLIDEVKP